MHNTHTRHDTGVDGLESVKQKVLNELTEVLEGDWSVFEQYHVPLRTYGMQLLGRDEVTSETRTEWVNTAGMKAFAKARRSEHLCC